MNNFCIFRASVFSINWQLLEFIWILFKFVCNTCSTPRSTFWSLFQIVFYFIPVKFWFKIHWSCTQLLALFCRIFVPTLAFDFYQLLKLNSEQVLYLMQTSLEKRSIWLWRIKSFSCEIFFNYYVFTKRSITDLFTWFF